MRQLTKPPLIQITACRRFATKPLSEPKLAYYWSNPWEQISVKFESQYDNFHMKKMNLNMSSPKWRPFCLDLNVLSLKCVKGILAAIYPSTLACTWNTHMVFASPWRLQMTWWRHQMETFFALLAICAGNSPVPVEFPAQRPVTRSFDIFFDLCLNKRLSKQWWGWLFETPSRPLWRHNNVLDIIHIIHTAIIHDCCYDIVIILNMIFISRYYYFKIALTLA